MTQKSSISGGCGIAGKFLHFLVSFWLSYPAVWTAHSSKKFMIVH
jgi:hypothetical protein